ncbi:glycosyltransferase family 2 protein [Fibrobacter sp. UWEL]|uniref:glycosyltransferase family 2 protein n=1 Tax=Fibrobacter sp. UWEL TaxID=1896209 RepID=UPI000913377F|nr:glycosyltransferase [Fibrobacter sp. UWEL]SHK64739.1 Glycosyltransferase, GT2 family [Fibrobacter sp. UWEL]
MIGFVILHYMAYEETIACVESILRNVKGEKKLVVVDNASPNDSYRILVERFKDDNDVDVVSSGGNVGFARGNNYGYAYINNHYHPDFVVVMNNDMDIQQCDFIDEIYNSFAMYKYFVCGPDIYASKKKYHQNPQTRKVLSKEDYKKQYRKLWIKDKLSFLFPLKYAFKSIFCKETYHSADYSKIPYIDSVVENKMLHGSCYIFSPLYIRKYPEECFYNKTFMYLEAEILHYLTQKRREKTIYYPFLKVNHHEDASTDATYKKQYKKSIFSVKCLLQSSKAFIELMNCV